jgi:hypothetical protein
MHSPVVLALLAAPISLFWTGDPTWPCEPKYRASMAERHCESSQTRGITTMFHDAETPRATWAASVSSRTHLVCQVNVTCRSTGRGTCPAHQSWSVNMDIDLDRSLGDVAVLRDQAPPQVVQDMPFSIEDKKVSFVFYRVGDVEERVFIDRTTGAVESPTYVHDEGGAVFSVSYFGRCEPGAPEARVFTRLF